MNKSTMSGYEPYTYNLVVEINISSLVITNIKIKLMIIIIILIIMLIRQAYDLRLKFVNIFCLLFI